MKIVWASNHHGQPTGYGVHCNHVVPHIQNNSHHEMIEFAFSGIQRLRPYEWKGVKVYGATPFGGSFGIADWGVVQALENPDVWMLHFDAWAEGERIRKTGVKYAVYPPIDHDPLAPVWEAALKGAVDIVPHCKFGARVALEGLGITAPISEDIPNGVDVNVFKPMGVVRSDVFGQTTAEDGFVVGIFKNNQGTRAKYDVVLEGCKMFLDSAGDESIRFYIHASTVGHQAPDLADLIRSYGLVDNVFLIAPLRYRYGLPEEEVSQLYNACDVVLNCVAGEGWGLPIIEAFACGKPVIGAAFSSMPELIAGVEGEIEKRVWDSGECIDAERGWLVPTLGNERTLGKRSQRRIFRPEDVAAALMDAYEHPEKRAEKGEKAREWVQQLDWPLVGDRWIKYLDGLEDRIVTKPYSWVKRETEPVGNNKTACVVFSFNRPDYLVQTLDPLSKNTRADECDWFFYQDGWKNDPAYPYASDSAEQVNRDLVQQCYEILAEFPFQHKEIIANETNVCIGRQLQAAKARLFKDYDHVIFFDDDHVVSRDYIDILLKMHEQYPGAVVGAQASEEKNIPADATLDEVGVTLQQDLGLVGPPRPGRWRWLGYLLPKAIHEKTVEEMDEYMELIGPSYRNIPHHLVRKKYGVQVTGFDGVMDSILEKHGVRRIATVIPRGRYIGEKGLFGRPDLYEAMGFPRYSRYEFDESEAAEFTVRSGCEDDKATIPKRRLFSWILDQHCGDDMAVLEIGRMRDISPEGEAGDGWSTLEFARSPKVASLYSVDNDPETLEVCARFPELSDVIYADSVANIDPPIEGLIDLLYLDAENDAEATVRHYDSIKGRLAPDVLIVIDDVTSPLGVKGDLVIPLLESEGYQITHLSPMALAKKPKPAGGGPVFTLAGVEAIAPLGPRRHSDAGCWETPTTGVGWDADGLRFRHQTAVV